MHDRFLKHMAMRTGSMQTKEKFEEKFLTYMENKSGDVSAFVLVADYLKAMPLEQMQHQCSGYIYMGKGEYFGHEFCAKYLLDW